MLSLTMAFIKDCDFKVVGDMMKIYWYEYAIQIRYMQFMEAHHGGGFDTANDTQTLHSLKKCILL